MFRKYEKTYRIDTTNIFVQGKSNLSYEEKKLLLDKKDELEITEKLDGANVAIIRGKGNNWTLQKRRGLAEEGVHPQFSFFWNWARVNEEKIQKVPSNWIVYGELMWAMHHIYYDWLPSYFIVFDIFDRRRKQFLHSEVRQKFCENVGFAHVPVLYLGKVKGISLDKFMYIKSKCATDSIAEGIVIKNWTKQMRAKIVRPEFMKELEEDDHWMLRAVRKNQLAKGLGKLV